MQSESNIQKFNLTANERIWWLRMGGVAATMILLVISAPLVWAAVSSGLGLLALAAIGLMGMVAHMSLPLGMQKLENHMLGLRKAEARRNPIEQLQNEVMRRAERLGIFRNALVGLGAHIESIEQMIESNQARFAGPVLARQLRALKRLQQFHSLNIDRLKQAETALKDFKDTVKQKERDWVIAVAIAEASRALDPNAADNLVQDLLADTALQTVQDRFNKVFAELDVQLSSMDAPTREYLDLDSLGSMDAPILPRQIYGGSRK